jgi:hydrogenase maturation factor
VRDWLIPSILAIIFCAWPLAIPGLIFAIKANSAKKQGDMALAAQQAKRARLWVLLSVALGVVVWIYLGYVISTTEIPTDQGTLTPFGA